MSAAMCGDGPSRMSLRSSGLRLLNSSESFVHCHGNWPHRNWPTQRRPRRGGGHIRSEVQTRVSQALVRDTLYDPMPGFQLLPDFGS